MATPKQVNLARQLSSEVYDPYGVSAGTQPNLKRMMANRAMNRPGRFQPRAGQYPHTQGLADLAGLGVGMYGHHLANQEGYAKDDRIAQALIGQIRGGRIGQADMPQRQPRVIPAEPTDRSEMEPDPNLPSMERMPPPQQTSGFDTSQYDSLLQPGPKGHYNLPGVRMAHQQFLGDRREYKQNIRADRIRKEDQIIEERRRQDTLAQQQRQFDLSMEKYGAAERSAERAFQGAERRHEASQAARRDRLLVQEENLALSRSRLTETERGNSLAEERIALNRIEVNIKNSNTVNEFKQKQFDDWAKDSKVFRSMQNRYIDFNNAIGQLNITGDYKAITEYLKMSDASLVSISEAEMVAKARSYPDLFRNFVDLVVTKEIALSPTQRKQLKTIAMNQWQAGVDSHKHSQDIALLAHSKVGLPGQLTKQGKLGKQLFLSEKVLREGVVPSYARKNIKHVTDFASESDKKVQKYMKDFNIEDFGEAQRQMRVGKGKPPPQTTAPGVVETELGKIKTQPDTVGSLPKPKMAGQIAISGSGLKKISVETPNGLVWVSELKLMKEHPKLWDRYMGGQR